MTGYAANPRTLPVLGDDPVPGDAAAVRQVIKELEDVVDAVRSATSMLTAIGADGSAWTGTAADAFVAHRGALVDRLGTARGAYAQAAEALETWLCQLESLQAEAEVVVTQARRMEDTHAAAVQNAAGAGAVPPNWPPAGFSALQHRHADIAADARRAAKQCADELDEAANKVSVYRHNPLQWITNLLVEGAPILHAVNEALGYIALVTAFIPVAGELVDLAYLGTGALLIGVDAWLAIAGEGKWSAVAGDALNVGLFGLGKVGRVAAKGAREVSQLERASARAAEVSDDLADAADTVSPVARLLGRDDIPATLTAGSRFADERSEVYASTARDLADDTSLRGSVSGALHELRHPIDAGHESKAVHQLFKESKAFDRLPSLQRWFPADNLVPTIGGQLAQLPDQVHLGMETYDHITEWIGENNEAGACRR